MPSDDILIQPQLAAFPGRPILFVVPGILVDEEGETEALARVARVMAAVERIANAAPNEYNYGANVDIVALVRAIYQRTTPAQVLPDTVDELVAQVSSRALTLPDTPFPEDVSLVVYLNPDTPRIPVTSAVYRPNLLMETGQTGVGIISLNAEDPLGRNHEVTPSLMGALYEISAAVQGRLAPNTRALSLEYARKVAWHIRFPDTENRFHESRFIQTDRVDRVGFESEIDGIRINFPDSTRFRRKDVLAATSETELGSPVMQLELDELPQPEFLGLDSGDTFYPELVMAP